MFYVWSLVNLETTFKVFNVLSFKKGKFVTKKAIIFDFGGVISKTLFETHDLTEIALGLPPGTLKWRGPFDPKNDKLWESMQAD